MADRARRFVEIWMQINLDYRDNPGAAQGSPPDIVKRLLVDAANEGITEQDVSMALGGNIAAAIFDRMMQGSSVPLDTPPTTGKPH